MAHVFHWPSLSQFRLPAAPLCRPLPEPGCGLDLLPTCVRPWPGPPAPPTLPGGLHPGTRCCARPRGGLLPPSRDAIRHSCRTFPLKIPAQNQPALPGEVLILVAFLPFIYHRVWVLATDRTCGRSKCNFRGNRPRRRVTLTPCNPKQKNPRKV